MVKGTVSAHVFSSLADVPSLKWHQQDSAHRTIVEFKGVFVIGRTFDAIRLTFFTQVLRIGESNFPTTYAAKVDAAQVGMYRVRLAPRPLALSIDFANRLRRGHPEPEL